VINLRGIYLLRNLSASEALEVDGRGIDEEAAAIRQPIAIGFSPLAIGLGCLGGCRADADLDENFHKSYSVAVRKA